MKNFGPILTELRMQKGLTQSELADKLGLSRSAIGMYEKGERIPKWEVLEVIADFFNVSMYELGFDSRQFKNRTIDDTNISILVDTASRLDEDRFKMLLSYARFLQND